MGQPYKGREDTCLAMLNFCGYTGLVHDACMKSCEFLPKTLDFRPTGSKDYYQKYSCCFWKNLPMCLCSLCGGCCYQQALYLRTLERMLGPQANCYELLCALSCVGMCCLSPCYYASVRADFRKKYDLKGSHAFDFWQVCCGCGMCVVCQDANQIMVEEKGQWVVPFAWQVAAGNSVSPA